MEKNKVFRERDYWEARFGGCEGGGSWGGEEWLGEGSEAVEEALLEAGLSPAESVVLVLGCGTSGLGPALGRRGWAHVLSLDFSVAALRRCEAHWPAPALHWLAADLRALPLREGSVDAVVDKATLDSLLTGESDPWRLSPEGEAEMDGVLEGLGRALRAGGVLVSLTWAQPHFRLPLLAKERFGWGVTFRALPSHATLQLFLYTATKGTPLDIQPFRHLLRLSQAPERITAERLSPSLPIDYLSSIQCDFDD